jgi:hypothetical protein
MPPLLPRLLYSLSKYITHSLSADTSIVNAYMSLLAELVPPEAKGEYHSNMEHPKPQGLAKASPA